MEALWDQPWCISSDLVRLVQGPTKEGIAVLEYYATNYYGLAVPANTNTESLVKLTGLIERFVHPKIVQFVGLVIEKSNNKPTWLVYEKLKYALVDQLAETRKSLPLSTILDVSTQICTGLLFLHSQNAVYGNLNSKNVLVGRGGLVKLFCVGIDRSYTTSTSQPVIRSFKQDIFDLGVVMLNLMTHTYFQTPTPSYIKSALKSYPPLGFLIKKMLAISEKECFTAQELLDSLNELTTLTTPICDTNNLIFSSDEYTMYKDNEGSGEEVAPSGSREETVSRGEAVSGASREASPVLLHDSSPEIPQNQMPVPTLPPIATPSASYQEKAKEREVPTIAATRTASAVTPSPAILPTIASTRTTAVTPAPVTDLPTFSAIHTASVTPTPVTDLPTFAATRTTAVTPAPATDLPTIAATVTPTIATTATPTRITPKPVVTKVNQGNLEHNKTSPTNTSAAIAKEIPARKKKEVQEAKKKAGQIMDLTQEIEFSSEPTSQPMQGGTNSVGPISKKKTQISPAVSKIQEILYFLQHKRTESAIDAIFKIPHSGLKYSMEALVHLIGFGVIRQSYSKMFALFQKGAEHGCNISLAFLAYCYSRGFGCTINKEESNIHATKAYSSLYRNVKTCNGVQLLALGVLLLFGIGCSPSLMFAINILTCSSQKGMIYAKFFLAIAKLKPNTTYQDIPGAVALLTDAADQKVLDAIGMLGNLAENGLGVPLDYKSAFKFYSIAAKYDHSFSLNNLGLMYEQGRGCAVNFQLAFQCYKESSALGNPFASNNLGSMFHYGKGVPKDYKQAFELYAKSALSGHAAARANIGLMYEEGIYVQKDIKQAIAWYSRAISSDTARPNGLACNNLARIYCQQGYSEAKCKGMSFFAIAAKTGNSVAQNNLGLLLEKLGQLDKAYQLFIVSMKNGYQPGYHNASRLALENPSLVEAHQPTSISL